MPESVIVSFFIGFAVSLVSNFIFYGIYMFHERALYYREHRELKQKLIQRLERKNDDINN